MPADPAHQSTPEMIRAAAVDALARGCICPTCHGCGRVSRGIYGEWRPQPTWTSSNTHPDSGPRRCPTCAGVGRLHHAR